jgi:lipoyl-dependent peroxiredoxin
MTGTGTVDRVGSEAFGPLDMTWAARTGEEQGKSSPEELIAAAHAACFSMALSNVLAEQGTPPTDLSTSVTITFAPGTGITTSKIEVEGKVPGIDEASFGRGRGRGERQLPRVDGTQRERRGIGRCSVGQLTVRSNVEALPR